MYFASPNLGNSNNTIIYFYSENKMKQESRNLAYLLITMGAIGLLAMSVLVATAQAEAKIVYLNKCVDESTYDCLNITQAAKRAETRQQVNQACRGRKCPTIYSVDPRVGPKNCNPDIYVGNCEWTFGAWKRHGRLEFAAMPSCPNARWELEKLLRRMR